MRPTFNQTIFTQIILILFFSGIAYSGWSATWFVKTTGDDSNVGNYWAQAFQTLQKAIDVANPGDEIRVAAGTYLPTKEADGTTDSQRDFTFYFDKDLTIIGGYSATGASGPNPLLYITTLSGDFNGDDGANFANNGENAYTVVHTKNVSSAFLMDGFYIDGGNADGSYHIYDSRGGGWFNDGSQNNSSNPTIQNCSFTNNRAEKRGGAMFNEGAYGGVSSPVLINCIFQNNQANIAGGAICNFGDFGTSSPTFTNCIFQNNQADSSGGALHNRGHGGVSSPTFTNCIFLNNQANNFGGAISNSAEGNTSTPTLKNCIFQNNQAKEGGAIGTSSSSPTIINCSFQNNIGLEKGGALFNSCPVGLCTLTIQNCIFWGNIGDGKSMYNESMTIEISNTLLEESTCPPGASCGTGMIYSQDPLFTNPANGDLSLQQCSRAIDVGDNAANSTIEDLAGNPRKVNALGTSTIDLGAYEYQSSYNNCTACLTSGNIIYVKENASGANSGKSWTDAFYNLQDAIDIAKSCSNVTEIWVAQGTYLPTKDKDGNAHPSNRDNTFYFDFDCKIYGGFPNTGNPTMTNRDWGTYTTTLSGDFNGDDGANFANNWENAYTVVFTKNVSSAFMMDGFVIEGGNSNGYSSDEKVDGGGWFNYSTGYADESNPTVHNCFFRHNWAKGFGGGWYNYQPGSKKPTFFNCSFIGNKAKFGGAMASLANYSTIFVSITNCSFYNNQADKGGALYHSAYVSNKFFEIKNCIFWQNIGDKKSIYGGGPSYQHVSNTLLEESSCPPNMACNSGMIYGQDPLFTDPSNGNLSLLQCSPAIDAGEDAANSEMYDLEGNTRKVESINGGEKIDMGAYEYQSTLTVTATCQSVTKVLDANGSTITVYATELDNGSSADCGSPSFLIDGMTSLDLDCDDTGSNNVTFTATDVYGQTSTCNTTITIEDNTQPNAICQNKTIQLDNNGTASITAAEIDNNSSDACGIQTLALDKTNFDCDDIGEYTVTLTVTDNNTNQKTCTATVTVEDKINPEISCPANITTAMDGGLCGATVSWSSATATDNCLPTVTQISGAASGSFFSEGTHTIEYKATDSAGNESDICSFTVTVEGDAEKPNFNGTCASYPTAFNTDLDQCYSSINFTLPNPTDNCGITELKAKIWDSNNNVVQNWTTNPDGQFAPDSYQIKWRAKDAAGNKKVCATNFTVQDAQSPDAQCVPSYVVQLSGGVGSITTSDIDAGSSDNCNYSLSLSETNFTCDDRGTQTVTMTATDDIGNTHQCTSDIEIKGTTLSIDDVSQNEGNGTGYTFFFFKIERAANGCAEQVDYETTDGDATLADNDYVYGSGTAYYPPGGSNIRYVICRGEKDSKYESDEDFWIELSNPTAGVSFTKDKGEAMLLNDDVAPLIGNPVGHSAEYQLLEGKVSLYPNPVIQQLTISTPYHWLEKGSIQVELLDVLGRKLSAFELTEDHTVVDVSALQVGQYELVFVAVDGRRMSERFVKVD